MEFTIFDKTITILIKDSLQQQIDQIVEKEYGYTGPYPKINRIVAYRQLKGGSSIRAKFAIEWMYRDNGQGEAY